VSRALNDDPRISTATRERLASTAETLGYVPDLAARSLALRSSRTFALMVPDATDPIHGTVVAGFETAADEAGYAVIIANSLGDPGRERRAIREFRAHRADGIALMSCLLDLATISTLVRPSPVVFLNSERLSRGRLADLPRGCLRPDEPDGIRLLVEHLVAQGCRRFAFVGADDRGASNAIRKRAVADEVRRRLGVEPIDAVSWQPDRRAEVAQGLRDAGADAVIGYDDRVALGLLDGFRTIGVAVPHDVAVAGFDGIPFAEISNPRLTTVVQPAAEMGAMAVDELLAAIATGTLAPSRVLPVQLVVRESTLRNGS
jgi:LacI family transcriptional regulator